MKQIFAPYVDDLNRITIEKASVLLDEVGAKDVIETINWPNQYPYKPETNFRIARSKDAIFIKYSVNGSMLKAVYTEDHSSVHEDSCVEFFCMPEGAEKYTNFEFNCIGTCSASSRKGRSEDVVPFSAKEMKSIERYSSVGTEPFQEKDGMFEWNLTVKIPMKLMGLDTENLPEKIRANFYKCADDTKSIHFVSWAPIQIENPDFHRPEFFGELFFTN
ncbi:MAG: hypothetical protein GX361_05830 [Bacteroidales bacterium]|nr:hypothetical protein [Bacteroidales bacterium]